MNNQQKFHQQTKHNKHIKTNQLLIRIKLKRKCQKELAQLQEERGKKYGNYVLGIQTIRDNQKTKTFTVTYGCDKSAIPLSNIRFSSPKHKIQIFKHLYLIYGFLNKEQMLHRNLKPNNIILYNRQLLLTDFGFKLGNWMIDKINFLDKIDSIQQDNMYPYLSPEIVNILVSQNSFGHKRDALKNRHQLSVKKQDQFAIAIMMLEVFIPLKDRKLATAKERQEQINDMNLSDDFSNEDEKFIKATILSLIYYKDFNENDFQNTLKVINEIEQQSENYKINKQELMTQEYDEQVKKVLANKDTQFNLKLLYHFNIKNLIDCQSIANNQENKELIEEITRFQLLYSQIDDLSLDTTEEHINQFTNEDLFILLVYLDEKIENLQDSQNKLPHLIMSEEEQRYRNLKQSLKKQYQRLNSLSKNQFTFNKILEKEEIKVNRNSVENNSHLNTDDIQHGVVIHQPIEYEQDQCFTPIYQIDDQSSKQNLLETVRSTFNNSTLQIYFEINKCLQQRQKKAWIYMHIDHPNVIYFGEKKDNVFEGEVMQFQEVKKIKMISHYVHVKIQLDSWNIQDIEKKSSIYYYIENRTPQKFQKVKEYSGQIKNGKNDGEGKEKDFIENMVYIGQWRDGQMFNQGIKQLINTDQILQNAPYKWEGNFEKNKLHGQNIKTYLLNYNNKEVWLEGSYQDGQKSGLHVCYMKRGINQQVQPFTLYRSLFFVFLNKERELKLTCY
ncbi:unnamed protein product (macronuclear) [Paramecium tetraurelia]|uniref:Protein kinase domain-containing protein n=1 Tax=Paramecium tetraurelia TaxID=5888 RepID=A0C0X4_PARTE|nr:uncharacterized protein GSPATT00033917001 [Paramecium tetraurelia]CAK64441.1 unnamed protein product [Paramecium tetraurelia]|eukprot:XP_001431839.1 hypothetical protein (macronuclear) [Paramecium tetraurelia strain d4-2]